MMTSPRYRICLSARGGKITRNKLGAPKRTVNETLISTLSQGEALTGSQCLPLHHWLVGQTVAGTELVFTSFTTRPFDKRANVKLLEVTEVSLIQERIQHINIVFFSLKYSTFTGWRSTNIVASFWWCIGLSCTAPHV